MTNESGEMRGDLFVDRLAAWTIGFLTVVCLGVAVYKMATDSTVPLTEHVGRAVLLFPALISSILFGFSNLRAFVVAAGLMGLRVLYDLEWTGRTHGKDRFASMAVTLSLAMLGYAILRIRALKGGQTVIPSEAVQPKRGSEVEESRPQR